MLRWSLSLAEMLTACECVSIVDARITLSTAIAGGVAEMVPLKKRPAVRVARPNVTINADAAQFV